MAEHFFGFIVFVTVVFVVVVVVVNVGTFPMSSLLMDALRSVAEEKVRDNDEIERK